MEKAGHLFSNIYMVDRKYAGQSSEFYQLIVKNRIKIFVRAGAALMTGR
jgi:hypothetical protein